MGAGRGEEVQALAAGFRVRVPATSLWFNVSGDVWDALRAGLEGAGAETSQGGLDGEVLCGVEGLVVSYRLQEGRLQAEVGADGGLPAARCLATLRAGLPAPAATASPIWLWSPVPFVVGEDAAVPASRFVRAARWVLPRERAGDVLQAAEGALVEFGREVALACVLDARAELEVRTAASADVGPEAARRAEMFDALLARLGRPMRTDYATAPLT